MLIGDPVKDKPLSDPANDHIARCNEPAANCRYCKQPFCSAHYEVHSLSCPDQEDLDDLAEENDARWREFDAERQHEREEELYDDSL